MQAHSHDIAGSPFGATRGRADLAKHKDLLVSLSIAGSRIKRPA